MDIIFQIDKRLYFLGLCLTTFLFMYVAQEVLITEELFYNSIGEQVAMERFGKWEITT